MFNDLITLKKCACCYGTRLKIQWNVPEKQSFEIYFISSTSEDFSFSIKEFDETVISIPEIVGNSLAMYKIEHVHKPKVWGPSDEVEIRWSEINY